ncbi:dedicator of cytokinesis protein 7 isoform X2 [Sipha flava]|uniref:Dedicator of cytokinesis protein 7 n=1 Tax=Sipha flava TaxID=143950 RepID=A0A2S2Q2X3_9HEMI|nr:dedicator of cytokinesis protein 7 isoform X2 [Sipha flava]
MVSQMQRAFAQKLTNSNVTSTSKSSDDSASNNSSNTVTAHSEPNNFVRINNIAPTIVEPVDYENYLQHHICSDTKSIENDDPLLEFPDGSDDVDVYVLPRKVRTLIPTGPEEDISKLAPHVHDFVRAYNRDWLVVDYVYRQINTVEDDRSSLLAYEDSWIPSSRSSSHSRTSTNSALQRTQPRLLYKNDHHNHPYKDSIKHGGKNSNSPSNNSSTENSLTSNNISSSSSATDLINTANDPLIGTVFQRLPIDTLDRLNAVARQENRQNRLFGTYLPVVKTRQKYNSHIEHPNKPPVPREIVSSRRILVKCLQLECSIDTDTEPIYAHISLYDVRRRKKMSENFYFDFNSCTSAGNEIDTTTRSRTCVIDIDGTGSSTGDDLFLVIRLEKPLRGDSDSVISSTDTSTFSSNNTDVKSSGKSTQYQHVKYRMPYAWTAVHMADVFCCPGGSDSLDRNSTGSGSNSLDGRFGLSEFDRFRKKWAAAGGSSADSNTTVRRGSLDRRTNYSTTASTSGYSSAATNDNRYSWSSDEFNTEAFRPVTLTVNGFFKQETDKLKDDDLYKLLPELKKPSSCPSKKLKNLNGLLKLDISPCPTDDVKQCLTPDLIPLLSYDIASEDKIRPIREILEFPLASCRVSSPHYIYRNLLYVYPKELNFAGRTGSARNIAVKIQLMCGERQPQDAAFAIFGKSSSPRFVCEAYTTVSYHQRCPSFYDEIKIKLPADLDDRHHLLFTFYHVSCRRRGTLVGGQENHQHRPQVAPETPIGYTWLPLLKDRCLSSGELCLPVALEPPPPANYSYITPDVPLPGIEWVENHKGLFTVLLEPVSSIHPRDIHLNNFFNYCSVLQHNPLPRRVAESNIEAELKHRISNLARCQIDPLIEFVPVVFDKLLSLLVESPVTQHQQSMNLGLTIFRTLTDLVSMTMSHSQGQQILSSYVRYQCCCCNVAAAAAANAKTNTNENENDYSSGQEYSERLDKYFRLRSNSDPDSTKKPCSSPLLDGNTFAAFKNSGLDRACSMKTGRCQGVLPPTQFEEQQSQLFCSDQKRLTNIKSVHEELAFQWVVSTSTVRRDAAANNSRFFFDVIVKSMAVSLAMVPGGLDSDRKNRFSDQFFDDISTLCTSFALDIVSNYEKCSKVNIINCNLAWFIHDLLSLADRGFVFGLINTYVKTIFSKQQSLLIQLPHHENYSALSSLKLDFLKIVCSHEHYVPLNLISHNIHNISPTYSVASTISNQSLSMASGTMMTVTESTVKEYAELSLAFRRHHYLVGLVLSEFITVLQCTKSDLKVKEKVVDLLLGLMSSHDTRYQQEKWSSKRKTSSRVTLMYLPLLTAVTTDSSFLNLLKLDFENNDMIKIKPNKENENDIDSCTNDGFKTPETNSDDNVNAISASSLMGVKNTTASWYRQTNKNNCRKSKLNAVTSTKVLACILWILKNLDNEVMHVWLAESSFQRAQNTLSLLTLCINRFYNNSNNYKKGNHKCVNCNSQSLFTSNINSSQPVLNETYCTDNSNNMSTTASSTSLSSTSTTQLSTTDDVKSRLEEVILGQGSARSELMRRKAGLDSGNGNAGTTSKVRWRKDHVLTYNRPSSLQSCACSADGPQQLDKIFGINQDQSDVEFDLVNEIGFIVLDTIEQIIQVASLPTGLKNSSPIHWSIHRVFKLLLRAMSTITATSTTNNATNSTTNTALQCMFGTQRSMVAKFPELLFGEGQDERDLDVDNEEDDIGMENYHFSTSSSSTNRCANLILMLLRHCAINSSTIGVRAQAAASLYSLMRQNFDIENNFARVKMQITVALSILIGGAGASPTATGESRKEVLSFNEEYLRRVLKTILLYAERDSAELQNTTFPDQVKDLVLNLHTILSDTVQMKEYSQDPDMLMDLMYRVAKGYQQTSSPDLRLAWLENMARKHSQRNNFTEAAMCLVHGASLVAEYLTTTENLDLVGCRGATCLECISPNVLEECAVSDDVMVVSQAADQVCLGDEFTEIGLVSLLDRSAELFQKAGMFEVMSQVYNKVAIPLIEKTNDYKKLSDTYLKLHDAYSKLERLQGRRVFGTYFRVGFYGAKFFGPDGLDGEEFVYKEPTLTKLSEIFGRLQNFYSNRFGEDCVTIIKDSNTVDVGTLDPRKAYIQITYVEPYFDAYECRIRTTHFQRNFNLKRFVFFTPFTPDGRAHGQLNQQYKRKTILTVAHNFPYLKTRIRVQSRQTVVMGPIEVALEDLRKKTDELARSVRQHPADPKMLQMVLQGCIGTTVNRGPMEMATVFLTPPRYDKSSGNKSPDALDESVVQPPPPRLQNKLRLCFKDFSKKCADALAKNKTLIGPDQRDYQRELERNYRKFTDQLAPLLVAGTASSLTGSIVGSDIVYSNLSVNARGPYHHNGACNLPSMSYDDNNDNQDEEDDTTITNISNGDNEALSNLNGDSSLT